jgi:hypothetical protein
MLNKPTAESVIKMETDYKVYRDRRLYAHKDNNIFVRESIFLKNRERLENFRSLVYSMT